MGKPPEGDPNRPPTVILGAGDCTGLILDANRPNPVLGVCAGVAANRPPGNKLGAGDCTGLTVFPNILRPKTAAGAGAGVAAANRLRPKTGAGAGATVENNPPTATLGAGD